MDPFTELTSHVYLTANPVNAHPVVPTGRNPIRECPGALRQKLTISRDLKHILLPI